MHASSKMYEYNAKILEVYDGDTFTALVDLGFNIHFRFKIRLAGVDTPEVRGEERSEGLVVRDAVRTLIHQKDVRIIVHKQGKYGRYVAEVFVTMMDTEMNLSEYLVSMGMAKRVDYG
jgi:micrococcal nuclease